MAITPSNTELGVLAIEYNSVDLGASLGNVTLSVTDQYFETKSDQWGETPLKSYLTGRRIEIACQLAEPTTAQAARILYETESTGGGSNTWVDISAPAGQALTAQSLVLKKYAAGIVSTDEQDHYTFDNVTIRAEIAAEFGPQSQLVYNVTFVAQPDDTGDFGHIGDNTA